MTNPILKAHLEGKDELDKVLSPQYGILVMLLKRFYPDGNIADEMAYDLFLEIKANTKSFLTTYAEKILNAAKEALPRKRFKPRKNQKWTLDERIIWNSCLASSHSAIDEGIKEITNN